MMKHCQFAYARKRQNDPRGWSREEDEILIKAYPTTPICDLMQYLPKRSRRAIISRANMVMHLKRDKEFSSGLKIGNKNAGGRSWTEHEKMIIETCYPNEKTSYIAEIIGCDVADIYRQARRMGIRKSAQYRSLSSVKAATASIKSRSADPETPQVIRKGNVTIHRMGA